MSKKIEHTGGFSYLEVLIAGAILSIVFIPLVAGFYQAAVNLKSSEQQYKAALCAKNLVVDAKTVLKAGGSLSAFMGELPEIYGAFDYAAQLRYVGGGVESAGAYAATATGLPSLPDMSVSNGSPELWNARETEAGGKRPCLLTVAVYDGSKQLCAMTVPAFEVGL